MTQVLGIDIALVVNALTTSPDSHNYDGTYGYLYEPEPWYAPSGMNGLYLNLAAVHPLRAVYGTNKC